MSFRNISIFLFLGLSLLNAVCAAPKMYLPGQEEEPELFHQSLPTDKLEIYGRDEADVANLTSLTRLCAHEVDALLGEHRAPDHRLNFFAMELSYDEAKFKSWDVPLRTNDPIEASVVKILQALFLRQLRERLNLRKNPPPASIPFLAAALANRIVNDGKGTKGTYRKDYRIPRRQFSQGTFPDVSRLLTASPPFEAQFLYRIYLVHCDLLLSCLERLQHRRFTEFLQEWWRLECQDQFSTPEALAKTLKIPPDRLQAWYVQQVRQQTTLEVRDEASTTVATRLQSLLTIPFVDMGEQETVRNVRLKDLPKYLKNRPPDVFALNGVQKDLLQLRLASPPIFHETIDLYIEAIDALRQNDVRRFQKKFKVAEKNFDQAQKLQRRITALLDEAEDAFAPHEAQRKIDWNVIIDHRNRLRNPIDKLIGL